jgi:hypothetical protein
MEENSNFHCHFFINDVLLPYPSPHCASVVRLGSTSSSASMIREIGLSF